MCFRNIEELCLQDREVISGQNPFSDEARSARMDARSVAGVRARLSVSVMAMLRQLPARLCE
jgi:hypothetical protein